MAKNVPIVAIDTDIDGDGGTNPDELHAVYTFRRSAPAASYMAGAQGAPSKVLHFDGACNPA